MIIKIIGASTDHFSNLYTPHKNEFIIGVDGGIGVLNKLNIKVDLAVGDFDSFNIADVRATNIIQYASQKNHSDLSLALAEAVKIPHRKILIYNCSGGRIDHLISAINDLFNYQDNEIYILDKYNKIFIRKGKFMIHKDDYKYISFFAKSPSIISLRDFKYPLENYELQPTDNLCLSNEIVAENGYVETTQPLLIIQSR